MLTLSEERQKKYIKTRFHQYFNFKINKNISTTETVNLVIPINSLLRTNNCREILNKYTDTSIPKEKKVYCTNVIDGDTIWVKDVEDEETVNIKLGEAYKVRFVGVDTPELNSSDEGVLGKAKIAKAFVESLCLHKFLYLNIDSEKEKDDYNRTLAVVIVENKNLNEILLKENMATVIYIPPSEFTPSDWDDTSTTASSFDPNSQDISILSPYFNSEMTNIVFTPKDNLDIIYRYEVYKGVIYLKLAPFSQNIIMHILPKAYRCSNKVLIFKEEDMQNFSRSNDYKVYEDRDNINAYFQTNGKDRDRTTITNRSYNKSNWPEQSNIAKTFVEFTHDISEDTKNFSNLQICAGYRYNNTSPYYALHYTGVKDNHGRPEDRCTLIDANIDAVKGNNSNIISQMYYLDPDSDFTIPDNDVLYIKHDVPIRKIIGNNDHISEIGRVFHKTIKYINDLLYVEEGSIYGSKEWYDPLSISDFSIETESNDIFSIKGSVEYPGNISIYLDDELYETIATDSKGYFSLNDIDDFPSGDHSIRLEYKDPNSVHPDIISREKEIYVRIPTKINISRLENITLPEEKRMINVVLLDESDNAIKNAQIILHELSSGIISEYQYKQTDDNGLCQFFLYYDSHLMKSYVEYKGDSRYKGSKKNIFGD